MKTKNRIVGKNTLAVCSLLLASMLAESCSKPEKDEWMPGMAISPSQIKIGVIYTTNPLKETSGYSFSHAQGIQEMQKVFMIQDSQIINKYNVSVVDDMSVESAIRDCIAHGVNIILATTKDFASVCEKLADEFPHIIFASRGGTSYNDSNFTSFFVHTYQACYLAGIAAGMNTKTNRIGFVAANGKSNSEVTMSVNAFALGVEQVSKNARVFVGITNTWFDPMGEISAARSLLDVGCDVIAGNCDSPNTQMEAQKKGALGIGYGTDMSLDAPDAVITSVVFRWGIYYTQLLQAVIEGTFSTEPYHGDLASGVVDITPLSDFANPLTEQKIAKERERIKDGDYVVFQDVLAENGYYRNIIERQH